MVSVMRTRTVAFAGIVAVIILLATGVASAQSTDPIRFRTPFEFVIGDQWVPAGEYTVSVVSPAGTLSFRSTDGAVSLLIGSVPVQATQTAERFKFIFNRYGDHYYMSQIWTPGYRTGRTLVPRTTELELAKNQKPQVVTVYTDAVGK